MTNRSYTLCVNAGSSSCKFKLYTSNIFQFRCELKNHSANNYTVEIFSKDTSQTKVITKEEFEKPLELFSLLVKENLQIELQEVLELVIFRIVHGGEKFEQPVIIDQDNLDLIRRLGSMAPLHSPKIISAIEESIKLFPNAKNYGVFDTSFHLTNPQENFLYALPYGYYENLGVRRFGFHGIAYANVLRKVREFKAVNPSLGKVAQPEGVANFVTNSDATVVNPPLSEGSLGGKGARYEPKGGARGANLVHFKEISNFSNLPLRHFVTPPLLGEESRIETISTEFAATSKIISCHLGSGSSVCAIKDDKSINHSFGFTPDENLIMATRSGEVDYDAIDFIKDRLLLSDADVTKLINEESGLLGVSGMSKDMKFLLDNYDKSDRAKLAVDMYVNKVVEYISRFYVELQGVDLITFSGGIGLPSFIIRNMIIQKLNILGIKLDQAKNEVDSDEDVRFIESADSICRIAVVKVDEEGEMVSQVVKVK